MGRGRIKNYGPFETLSLNELPEGQVLLTLPFAQVEGAQILVALTASIPFGQGLPGSWLTAEVGIWGSFQGFQSLIKRAHVRQITGPLSYQFQDVESYDQIIFKVRNMSGGRRGPPQAVFGTYTVSNGCSLAMNVFVQPRSGVGGFSHNREQQEH